MKPVFVTVEQLNETIQMPNNFEEAENEVDELKEHEIKENEKEYRCFI